MRLAAFLLLLWILPASVESQAPVIPAGTRVKVETQHARAVSGTLMLQTDDSIVVAASRAPRTVLPMDAITRILVSEGPTHSQGAVKGLKMGALIGGGVGAAFFTGAYLASSNENKNVGAVLALTSVTALTLAVEGAAVGALLRAEKWRTVYSRLRASDH